MRFVPPYSKLYLVKYRATIPSEPSNKKDRADAISDVLKVLML